MTAPKKNNVRDAMSLNNTTIGIPNTSPVACGSPADDGLLERNPGTDDTKDKLTSPEQSKFTEAISKAMSKELVTLNANRDQTAVRPTAYRVSEDGTTEDWVIVMKLYLEKANLNSSPVDKALGDNRSLR